MIFPEYASETDLVNALRTGHSGAFACLYDQYAPVLLGIIAKTIGNEQRANLLLTDVFTTVRAEIVRCPPNQPLFLWLFDITRKTAANAIATPQKSNLSAVHLTTSGRLVTEQNQVVPAQTPVSAQQRLLNALLFERCTPQEASQAAGLPAGNARQQLRQAFLQLRQQQA